MRCAYVRVPVICALHVCVACAHLHEIAQSHVYTMRLVCVRVHIIVCGCLHVPHARGRVRVLMV